MLDEYCQWAANNVTAAWAIFIGSFVVAIAAVACWPRKLPDLDKPEDYGC